MVTAWFGYRLAMSMTRDTGTARPTTTTGRAWSWLEPWLPALTFALLLSLFSAWWNFYEYDRDEGLNLGKSMLVAMGYHPYQDIWNDQPPVLTYLLALQYKLTGSSVVAARLIILCFSMLILRSVYVLVRQDWGRAAGWWCVGLLAASAAYSKLSVSVMIGLPAIAVAMFAAELLLRRDGAALWRVVLAGICFGVALQIKFFVTAAIPALLLAGFLARGWRGAAIVAGATVLTFAAIAVISGEPFLAQIIAPHIADGVRSELVVERSATEVLDELISNAQLLVPALLSFGLVWKTATGKVASLWFAVGAIALCFHHPVWYHHSLLYLVPLTLLCGPAVAGLWRWSRTEAPKTIWILAAMIGAAALLQMPGGNDEDAVAAELIAETGTGGWVLTDRPMDAYRAGLPVPPETVVYSRKRVDAGNIGPGWLIDAIQKYDVEQVMMRRFEMPDELKDWLDGRYRRLENDAELEHYLRIDDAAGG